MKEQGMPIKIFVRIKPQDKIVEYTDKTITIYNMKNKLVTFLFDKVLGPNVTNKEIYKIFEKNIKKISKSKYIKKENLIEKDIEDQKTGKKKITIMAYGQTGSGKTYTMMGTKENPGLVYLLIKDILKYINASFIKITNEKKENLKYRNIKASFIEIYNEKIIDLIDMTEKEMREVDGKVKIPQICEKEINTIEYFEEIIKKVMSNRMSGETRLNKSSSRSHLIVKINIEGDIINLVDLAGSENNRKTGNEGVRMQESSNINKSLFVLNKVINAIINKEKRIPYRDSKLTRMLKEYIGGIGECFLIATVVDCLDESGELISTLNFATRSNKVINIIETGEKKDKVTENIFDILSRRSQENKKLIFRKKIRNNEVFKDKLIDSKILNNVKNNENNINSEKNNINDNKSIINEYTKINNKIINGNNKSFNDKNIIDVRSIVDSSIIERNINKNKNISQFSEKNKVEMTPITKKKSLEYFLSSAKEVEEKKEYKNALEIYKTIKKFADSEFINMKILKMQNYLKKEKIKYSKLRVLEILNSGIFIEIKKLNGIGDKRAQSVVDFIRAGYFFKSINDLKLIFSDKIIESIKESIES